MLPGQLTLPGIEPAPQPMDPAEMVKLCAELPPRKKSSPDEVDERRRQRRERAGQKEA